MKNLIFLLGIIVSITSFSQDEIISNYSYTIEILKMNEKGDPVGGFAETPLKISIDGEEKIVHTNEKGSAIFSLGDLKRVDNSKKKLIIESEWIGNFDCKDHIYNPISIKLIPEGYGYTATKENTVIIKDEFGNEVKHINVGTYTKLYLYPPLFKPGTVNFEDGSATLIQDEETIKSLGQILQYTKDINRRYPCRVVNIYGHTSSKGSEEFNLNLSQERAEEIIKWLVEKGAKESHLKAIGKGEDELIYVNEHEDEEASRRVEVLIGERI